MAHGPQAQAQVQVNHRPYPFTPGPLAQQNISLHDFSSIQPNVNDSVGTADHTRLIQAGNRAHIQLFEMYVSTKAELDAIKLVFFFLSP